MHLDPVSRKENILRGEGVSAKYLRRNHCKHGHEYTPENTKTGRKGGRVCLTCEALQIRKQTEKMKNPTEQQRKGHNQAVQRYYRKTKEACIERQRIRRALKKAGLWRKGEKGQYSLAR